MLRPTTNMSMLVDDLLLFYTFKNLSYFQSYHFHTYRLRVRFSRGGAERIDSKISNIRNHFRVRDLQDSANALINALLQDCFVYSSWFPARQILSNDTYFYGVSARPVHKSLNLRMLVCAREINKTVASLVGLPGSTRRFLQKTAARLVL